VTPALDSVFMMMDIGLSASFCQPPLAWKAARIDAVMLSLVLVELLLVELPVVALLLAELLLELEPELALELGGGGAPFGPPRACARS